MIGNRRGPKRRSALGVMVAAVLLVAGLPLTSQAAPKATIAISDVALTEGNSGVKVFAFTASLRGKGANASVDYSTTNGSATAPGDYQANSGSISFAGGKRQKILVSVFGDTTAEGNETFSVYLSNAINATISDAQGVGTIVDDDQLPTLSVRDAIVGEGDSGDTTASFEFALSNPAADQIAVNYTTVDSSATAPADYASASGTITFEPGEILKTMGVAVHGDSLTEGDETFAVELSGASGATVSDGQAVGIIVDDENAPAVSIGDVTVVEGDAGTTEAALLLTLSHSSSDSVTVNYATADASATAPSDYQESVGTVTFDPMTTTRGLTVPVQGDLVDEPNKTFFVTLSSPVNAVLADAQGTVVITDDDATASVAVADTSVLEGDSGTVMAVFPVTLSNASSQEVTVEFETSNGTASAPADYLETSGTVAFPPGTVNATAEVPVVGDTVLEIDEVFSLDVISTTGADLSHGRAEATITDDEPEPTSTVLKARRRGGRVTAQGWLTPAHPGNKMLVTLYKKKGARFVKVRSKQPLLSAAVDADGVGELDSRFKTRFPNPARTRRCRVVAKFTGDADHLPSRSAKTFNC
jgi:hypothetical protein